MKTNTGRPIDLGTHVCHLYYGEDDLKEVTIPFLRDGLRDGDYCLYASDGAAADYWYRELEDQGVDVRSARMAGSLDIIGNKSWREHCYDGSIAMAREVLKLVDSQLDDFAAIRIAGDIDWATDPDISADVLCHWEATANFVFQGLPARVICQYNIARCEPAFIHAALRTHPIVLYKGRRVRSPYYQASLILEQEPTLNACSNDAKVVADMLAQLMPRAA